MEDASGVCRENAESANTMRFKSGWGLYMIVITDAVQYCKHLAALSDPYDGASVSSPRRGRNSTEILKARLLLSSGSLLVIRVRHDRIGALVHIVKCRAT